RAGGGARRTLTAARGRAKSHAWRSGSAPSDFLFRLEHLAAAIHAGLEIDMVRAAQLAGILVLDIGRRREGVGRAAHAAERGRGVGREGEVLGWGPAMGFSWRLFCRAPRAPTSLFRRVSGARTL